MIVFLKWSCFYLVLVIFSPVKSYAQCSIDISEINDSTVFHEFMLEQICDVDNSVRFEDGGGLFICLETYAVAVKHKHSEASTYLAFKLYIGKINTISTFAPREVSLTFENGEVVVIISDLYDIAGGDTDRPFTWYNYRIEKSTLMKLSNFNVTEIHMRDTRLNEIVSLNPFDEIFKTQIRCISKSVIDNLEYTQQQ